MNRKFLNVLLSICLVLFCSCRDNKRIGKQIIGKWEITKVKELSEDVTERHNPDQNRWISFIEDIRSGNHGIYESGRGNTKENSGKWYYDNKENELYLDSDAGEDDDSYWSVTIEGSAMYWKGRKFEFNKRFEIEYLKIE